MILSRVAVVVLALAAVQLLAGTFATGVTIDEPIEADSTKSWLEHGWYLPSYVLTDGSPTPGEDLASPYVYGPAYGAIAHIANTLVGNEGIGEISLSASAYDIRHLVAALLAALAVAAVGFAVRTLTGSRSFGLWAAAALVAMPEWSGQAFFNPKDVPAACGYTLATVALLLALDRGSDGAEGKRRRLGIGVLLAVGILVGAGTRLALIIPFLLSVLVYAALRLGQTRLGGIGRDSEADLAVGAGTGVGLAAIAVFYPKVADSPLTLLTESVSGSGGFPWQGVTLTAGQLLSEHPPWWYLPTWIGASLPLLVGALAVLGGVLAIRTLVKTLGKDWRGPLWSGPQLGLVPVLQQALLLPVGAILTGAVMYSGMRQHLYVLPALAILAGIGAERLWRWGREQEPVGRWPAVATGLLCAALILPMLEQVRLFPYNYAYVNPLARIGGVDDRWETDYWFASAPEAISHVPAGAEMRCYLIMPTVPCDEGAIVPFLDLQGSDVDPEWGDDTSSTWAIVRRHADNPPPPYCERADDVTRSVLGATVTMSFVLRCDR